MASIPTVQEATMSDAPPWKDSHEANAWADGWNACLAAVTPSLELLHRIAVARRGDCPDVDENLERLPEEIEELWTLLRMERDAHWTERGV